MLLSESDQSLGQVGADANDYCILRLNGGIGSRMAQACLVQPGVFALG